VNLVKLKKSLEMNEKAIGVCASARPETSSPGVSLVGPPAVKTCDQRNYSVQCANAHRNGGRGGVDDEAVGCKRGSGAATAALAPRQRHWKRIQTVESQGQL